ncbi:acyl-CoA synthetase [Novosphingobium bradum]|uniref:Acyl-CoA synthetase n=1 Tax=Novosphingobium bradum TaxID=1737444 RepID=A0ABV7IMF6_9SPHN
MNLSHWASVQPDQPAVIMAASGETVTFGQVEEAANQGAQLLRRLGLKRGDTFALWSGNNPRFIEIAAAMARAGVYMVPIASKLHAEEAAYIINDCGAKLLIVDAGLKHASELVSRFAELCPKVADLFTIRGDLPGVERWEVASAAMPATLIADPSAGTQMIYSSGTTGKPKGVKRPLPEQAWDAPAALGQMFAQWFNSRAKTTFIVSAPLYHSGSFGLATAELSVGATVLLFEKFDPEAMLAAIERWRPERGQFVPTMFVRMLKLPEEVRARYDVSSLESVIHSAGPCSAEVKRAMIEWWGPVLQEIYGGTENVGSTMISSEEWLRKPGSVGRAQGTTIRICDEAGDEVPVGQTGTIFFEGANTFEYHGDPKKTAGVRHPVHPNWATFGDIGRIDEEGYLYLSDRKAFMIICGGVNIYPQEAEDVLTLHPEVADVAVFGVPDADLGEQVKAVIQPAHWAKAGPELERELIAFCRGRLSTLKCPVTIDFEQQMPRDEAGKLAKRVLRDRYWQGQPAAI